MGGGDKQTPGRTSLRRGSRLTSDSRSSRDYLSQLRRREVTAIRLTAGWGRLPLGGPPGSFRRGGGVCHVLAGVLFQALLVAGSWVVRRGAAERTAIADSYRELCTTPLGSVRPVPLA
jgi:hypothetical protein